MLTPTSQGHANTVNLAQLTDEAKTCYIAQPFGYANYALVNQMPIGQGGVAGIATVDSNGRIQVVNKPITNTISNISFKCDVCGLIFSHLTLLNHHKRVHTQDGTDNATETIDPNQQGSDHQQQQQQHHQAQHQQHQAQQQQQHHQQHHQPQHQQQHQTHQQQQQHMKVVMDKHTKCITCGGPIIPNPKRKGPKLIRCETCINNDNALMTPRQTQIFVAPDGDVKFEMSEIRDVVTTDAMDGLGTQNVIPIVTIAPPTSSSNTQHTVGIKQPKIEQGVIANQAGYYPVKKRNLAAVTKCHKCNGSGVIFIGGHKNSKVPAQDKPFHCNICGGSFSRYSSLWSHKKLHSGEKNYKCSICGLAFAKAVYLKNHSRIHTGEKPYKCATCGMQFSQSPHLKNHERTHSGEKPYVCEVCDKGFARHATLWNHRRIHTGEKPYKCEICGSAFSQAAHLKNHAKVHSGEKPFKCDICSAAFADRFALKRHRRIHEKYGQTAPRQPAIQQEEMIVQKEEVPDVPEEDENNHPHNEVIIGGLQ